MNNQQIVWLVGKCGWPDYLRWECVGVFTTADAALAQCKNRLYFITQIEVDQPAPDETTVFPECRFPHPEIAS